MKVEIMSQYKIAWYIGAYALKMKWKYIQAT